MSYGHYPPQHHYGSYGAPAPQPPQDPFRAWYAARLSELTFNSRPIIQTLSLEAMNQRDQNNWNGMQAVVEEIEGAIMRAPPHGKLPLLYLLDSISKNVGPPYTDQLLPTTLPELYIRTYREVDGVTKSKMEEMLKLWRTGGPYGGELYPQRVREAVERAILGSQPIMTQAGVQATLRDFLREKEEEMAREFSTQRAKTVNVLVQIDQLLTSSQVSPKELAEISEKIRAMKAGLEPNSAQLTRLQAPAAGNGTPPPHHGFGHRQPQQHQQQQHQQQQHQQFPPQQFPPPQQQQYPPYPPAAPPVHAPIPVPAAVPSIPAIPAISTNIADILRNITSTGILSQPRTPEPAAASKTSLDHYEDMILALDMHVDVFDLSKLSLPVSHLPVRCKQCGLRFPEGENKLQAHMDWHFRRNRKERETDGRGAHRKWLPRAAEWIDENVEGAGPSTTSPKKNEAAALPALTGERLAALKRKWVPAPSDPVKAKKPCPICKEQFKSEWSEDEEEWVFMNAVEAQGVIYHATCRASRISSAAAARLLGKDRGASESPAPSDDGSTKRKVSEEIGEDAQDDAKRVKVQAIEAAAPVAAAEGDVVVVKTEATEEATTTEAVESEAVKEAAAPSEAEEEAAAPSDAIEEVAVKTEAETTTE